MRENGDPTPPARQPAQRAPWDQRRPEEPVRGVRGSGFREAAPHTAPSSRRDLPAWHARQESLHVESAARPPRPGAPPRLVSYLGEDRQVYMLRDLLADVEAQVAKRRAAPEPFPPSREQRAVGSRLLRLSGYALFGSLLGGAPGAALGTLVALVALARLVGFERRAHAWRVRAAKDDAAKRLPAAASNERLRLMTALWQGVVAMTLGGCILALLLTATR